MTEKEKSKHNPFVAVLGPDEEILWFYTSDSSWDGVEMLKRAARIAILFLFSFLLGLCAAFLVQGLVLGDNILLSIGAGMFGFIVVYGLAMLYPFTLLRASRPHAYAVTNKRLLSSVAGKVTAFDLDNIDMLHMSSSEEGHLFFSASIPEWRHIPHPQEVIEIIQQAKRIHRLDIEHEGEHDETTEEQVQSLRSDAAG
jgi:hypothetical protein